MKKLFILLLISLSLPFLAQAQVASNPAARMQVTQLIEALKSRGLTPIMPSAASAVSPMTYQPVAVPRLMRNLTVGDKGEDVRSLQTFLKTKGYFKDEATGFFGPMTATALTDWQMAEKIITNRANGGVVGTYTRSKLDSLAGSNPMVSATMVNKLPGSRVGVKFGVTNPLPDSELKRGERFSITWRLARTLATPLVDTETETVTNEVPALDAAPEVNIILLPVSGQPIALISNLANKSFYHWTPANTILPGKYRVQVESTDRAISATSEVFTLK